MELKKTLIMNKGRFQMRANLPQKEPLLVKRFEEEKLYEEILEKNKDGEEFYLHDGPPYANGDIHLGHALNKIVKDFINRYKALKGYKIKYIPGWDTHGLPIENAVSKLGVDRKKVSIAEFRKACMKYAYKQIDRQMKGFKRLGVIGDFSNPYITMEKSYEASELEIFAKMAMEGYIYKGLKPVAWSPSSECALAEAEIEYHNVKAKTLYVKMPIKKSKDGLTSVGDYFLIWTTTPWTIPADTAVCLNPEMEYGLYATNKGNLVIACELIEKVKEECHLEDVTLLGVKKGKEFEFDEVTHPLYPEKTSLVIVGDHVTADSGTGCVHTAGGHGLDDYKVCLKYHIAPFCPVDEKGYMTKEAGNELAGLFYEDCNIKVIEILDSKGLIAGQKEIEHSYPHDWRTNKPIIFRATSQWFCSISKIRDEILKKTDEIQYKPSWGKVRLQHMIEGREDWCISRQRAWGVPIPIIYNEDGSPILEKEVFDHIIKLVRENGSNIWFEKEAKDLLPEGYTNPLSPNGKFTKEKDILDVWFDSGSSFLGAQIERNSPYPADLIFEGTDQYRGWYNASLTLAVASEHGLPFKMILTHGFIVDQNGEKFSKSKGNGIAPDEVCSEYGADILRLWAATIDFKTAEIKASKDLFKVVSENYRKIRNTFKFMLANLLEGGENEEFFDMNKPYEYSYLDKLILSKFYSLLDKIDKEYAEYDFLTAISLVLNFLVNDLSSFYLDVNKDTLYCEEKDSLKRKGVQHVLYEITYGLSVALSSIIPFTCEEVYSYLPNDEKFVALCKYPRGEFNQNMLNAYQTLVNIRQKVYKELEGAKQEGVISSYSEAEVSYKCENDEEKKLIANFKEGEMEFALMIAKFALAEQDKIEKTSYERCDRCWNYKEGVTVDSNGNKICPRCGKVISHE